MMVPWRFSKKKSQCFFAGVEPATFRFLDRMLYHSAVRDLQELGHPTVLLVLKLSKDLHSRKSELDKSVDLSLCGLAPAQSQMDLFLDTLCARNKQGAANFNQSEKAMSRVTASAMFFFRGNGYSKNRLIICDCAGDATQAITHYLIHSLFSQLQ